MILRMVVMPYASHLMPHASNDTRLRRHHVSRWTLGDWSDDMTTNEWRLESVNDLSG